jgi:hypothetical protein
MPLLLRLSRSLARRLRQRIDGRRRPRLQLDRSMSQRLRLRLSAWRGVGVQPVKRRRVNPRRRLALLKFSQRRHP